MFKKVADKALLSKLRLTTSQLRMLMAVRHNPNLSQHDIAEFWNITEASASRQIGLLDSKGMIRKKRDPKNRRKYVLELTNKGNIEVRKAMTLMHNMLEKIFKDIMDKDRGRLKTLLVKFTDRLKSSDLMRNV